LLKTDLLESDLSNCKPPSEQWICNYSCIDAVCNANDSADDIMIYSTNDSADDVMMYSTNDLTNDL